LRGSTFLPTWEKKDLGNLILQIRRLRLSGPASAIPRRLIR
jgi:hypothetical protein